MTIGSACANYLQECQITSDYIEMVYNTVQLAKGGGGIMRGNYSVYGTLHSEVKE